MFRRKSNRESARRSRMRKLEETQESEGRVAALQELLTVAHAHLETMKGCLLREEDRCERLRNSVCTAPRRLHCTLQPSDQVFLWFKPRYSVR